MVGHEPLACQAGRVLEGLFYLGQVGDEDQGTLAHPPAGLAFLDLQARLLVCAAVESQTGAVFKHLQVRIEQENVSGVHFQLLQGMRQQDVESETQFQAAGDSAVDLTQGADLFQVLPGLLVQGGAVNGIGGDIGDGREQAHFILADGGAAADPQRADGLLLGDQRRPGCGVFASFQVGVE